VLLAGALDFLLQLSLKVLVALPFRLHKAVVQPLQLFVTFAVVIVAAAAVYWIHAYVLSSNGVSFTYSDVSNVTDASITYFFKAQLFADGIYFRQELAIARVEGIVGCATSGYLAGASHLDWHFGVTRHQCAPDIGVLLVEPELDAQQLRWMVRRPARRHADFVLFSQVIDILHFKHDSLQNSCPAECSDNSLSRIEAPHGGGAEITT
jgi:hypothetical protein